jgi:hypothetical protein
VNDSGCIQDSANEVLKDLHSGIRNWNLIPFDPLHLDKVEIIQGKDGPIHLAINVKNANLFGISKAKCYYAAGFTENPKDMTFKAKIPKLTFLGDYKGNGQILIIPFRGSGKINVTYGRL